MLTGLPTAFCLHGDPIKFKVFIDALVKRVYEDREDRDVYAEERLEFLTNVKHCREPVYFNADLVRAAFWALYTEPEPRTEHHFGMDGWEAAMGLSQRVTHAFFPPSVLQGPFRSLLLYSCAKSVRYVIRPDLRDGIFAILDKHIEDLKCAKDVPDGWLMGLKRMDARGMKYGEPIDDGRYVPLEIANLEPELKQVSDEAQSRSQLMNRLAALRLWAGAVTQPALTSAPGAADRFSSSSEVYGEFQRLLAEVKGHDEVMLLGLNDDLPCALIQRWPTDTSEALRWAKEYSFRRADGPDCRLLTGNGCSRPRSSPSA